MPGSAQPEDRLPSADKENAIAVPGRTSAIDALGQAGGSSSGSRAIEETELDSALQLLVERAQYITGATGAALALPLSLIHIWTGAITSKAMLRE